MHCNFGDPRDHFVHIESSFFVFMMFLLHVVGLVTKFYRVLCLVQSFSPFICFLWEI